MLFAGARHGWTSNTLTALRSSSAMRASRASRSRKSSIMVRFGRGYAVCLSIAVDEVEQCLLGRTLSVDRLRGRGLGEVGVEDVLSLPAARARKRRAVRRWFGADDV